MKTLKTLTLAIASMGMFALASCEQDPCADTNCGANGLCDDGTCVCEIYYEGESCETEMREKFEGTYTGRFTSGNNLLEVPSLTFSRDLLDVSKIVFNEGKNYMIITSSTEAELPEQDFEGIPINGTAIYNDGNLVIDLNVVVVGQEVDFGTFDLIKK